MKTLIRFCIILLAVVSLSAAGQQGVKIVDHGLDGDRRYYSVYCPDGEHRSMTKQQQSGKVCISQPDGREECHDRSLDEAARAVCARP